MFVAIILVNWKSYRIISSSRTFSMKIKIILFTKMERMCGLIVVPKKVKGQETWCDSFKNCKYIEACQFPHCYRYKYQIIRKGLRGPKNHIALFNWHLYLVLFVLFVNTWQLLSSCQHDYLTCQGSFVLLCVMSFIQTVAQVARLSGLSDIDCAPDLIGSNKNPRNVSSEYIRKQ